MERPDPRSLTVIIPSWNRRQLLQHCLQSLRAQTLVPRVLVVDNGSSDGSAEMVEQRFPEFECLRLKRNQGFARAVNRGIRHSRTPWLALLNNDTEADPGWVEAGLNGFRRFPQYSFCASRMVRYFNRQLMDSAGDTYDRFGRAMKRGLGQPVDGFLRYQAVPAASAGAAFYRRRLFDEIGLFDEEFYLYLEDVELSLRAQLQGHRCFYNPEAIVYHIEAASDPSRDLGADPPLHYYSKERVFWITRNRWQLMVLYQPLRHLPWLAVGWGRSLLFHLLRAGRLGAFLSGLLHGIGLTPRLLRKRRRLRSRKTLSTNDLCRMMRRFSPSV